MYTLGINAAFHDCAACLIKDGIVIAAVEEERFTHVKHGKRPVPFTVWQLPYHAIDYCLAEAGISLADVHHIAYSLDPKDLPGGKSVGQQIALPIEPSAHAPTKDGGSPWDPLVLSYVINAPRQLAGGAPHHIRERFRGVRHDGPFKWHFVEHHMAHEASAFLAAPFEECAVMTLDGRGENATTTYGIFSKGKFERIGTVNMPHSLGMLYERVTTHLGFLHSSDEYKVMALASYGEPTKLRELRDLIHINDNGQYEIEFNRLNEVLGKPRKRGGPVEKEHYNIACSLQQVLEETVLKLANWLYSRTKCENLAMAGGVALNCVMNARVRDEGLFKNVWVQPAAGDAGTALGAALWIDYVERGHSNRKWTMEHAYWGPDFSDDEIEEFLTWSKLPYRRLNNIAEEAAAILADGKVIGWFQGKMEFGPRALGSRSILASPIPKDMQAKLNEIKDREDFRPVAPVVLEEEANNWFKDGHRAPFMLFVFDVLPEKAELIPAVRHVDGTARVQTINRNQNALYYDLIAAFQKKTGIPVLVNTSFNTRGEPIVCTPRDAIESFWTSPLDALVIGSFLLEKNKQQADMKIEAGVRSGRILSTSENNVLEKDYAI
jgi:carbamoyltransferase